MDMAFFLDVRVGLGRAHGRARRSLGEEESLELAESLIEQ
jgi:hypothetical protein